MGLGVPDDRALDQISSRDLGGLVCAANHRHRKRNAWQANNSASRIPQHFRRTSWAPCCTQPSIYPMSRTDLVIDFLQKMNWEPISAWNDFFFLLLRWGCREHFVSGCWHCPGRDCGRYPRECWLSTLGVLHPGVPVM